MRTRHAVTFWLLLALAATPTWGAPLLSDASLVCGQTPSATAGDAANSQITPDDPQPGAAACADLCGKWVKTCKGLVSKMKSCWLGAVGRMASLRNAVCGLLDDAAKDSCKDTVTAEKDAAKQFVLSDVENGVNLCESGGLASCLVNCT